MKLWIDPVAPAPEGYRWCKRIGNARDFIETHDALYRNHDVSEPVMLVDVSRELIKSSDQSVVGFLEILAWIDEKGSDARIRLHSSAGKSDTDKLALAEAAPSVRTDDDVIVVDPDAENANRNSELNADELELIRKMVIHGLYSVSLKNGFGKDVFVAFKEEQDHLFDNYRATSKHT